MTRKYSILRSTKGRRLPAGGIDSLRDRESVTGAPGIFAEVAAVGAGEANIDVAELTPHEVTDLTRDPSVAVVAPTMPIRLIAPFEAAPPPADAPVWGLGAVGADRSKYDGADVVVA